jgi:hypothetical protein
MQIDIKTALIGAIGGLVGGVIIAVISYFFNLEASRQALLKEERRNAYVQWLEVRTLDRKLEELKNEDMHDEAVKVKEEYDIRGRVVMGKIATYGEKEVVESVAQWYRADSKLKSCTYSSEQDKKALLAEINAHQKMRDDLMTRKDSVDDADMAVLLLQCDLPPNQLTRK